MTSSKKARTDSKMVMETAWGKTLSSRGSIKSPLSYTKHCAKCQKHCHHGQEKSQTDTIILIFPFFFHFRFSSALRGPKAPWEEFKAHQQGWNTLIYIFFVLFTLTGSNLFLSVCSSTEQQTGAGSIKQDFCKRSPERETVEEKEDQRL